MDEVTIKVRLSARSDSPVEQRTPGLRALALTSSAFAGGPDRGPVLERAASLLADALECGCTIRWLAERRGVRVAVGHPSPEDAAWLRGLVVKDRAGIAGAFDARVRQTREPATLSYAWSALLRLWTSSVYWPYLESHQINGLLVMPLCTHQTVVGVLTTWREQPRGAFDAAEAAFVEEVSRRLALC